MKSVIGLCVWWQEDHFCLEETEEEPGDWAISMSSDSHLMVNCRDKLKFQQQKIHPERWPHCAGPGIEN